VQMDQTTQQNAALVEEASAAAQSLQQEAASLARTVGAFRTEGGATAAAAAPTRQVAPVAPVAKAQPRVALAKPAVRQAAEPQRTVKKEAVATTAGDGWEEF
jgi:type II secretory pathway component HofQ